MVLDAPQFAGAGVRNDDLAGFHVPQKGSAGGIESTALAGEHITAAGKRADAERTIAARVADRDQLGGRHDDQTVRAFQHVHRLADGRFDAAHPQTVAGHQIADDLGIRGAVEDRALVFQLTAKLQRVGQVAVVAQGHRAAAMADDHRLGVGPHPAASRGIPDVAGGHVGRGTGQACQHRRGEHLVHKAKVAVATDHAVIVDRDAAALLTTVLQRVQCRVGGSGHIFRSGTVIDSKNAALFVKRICKIRH